MGLGYTSNRERPEALRRFRIFESMDVEYTRDRISEFLQPHELAPSSNWEPINCYLDHIPVGRMGIGAIGFGGMQVHVPEIADYHLFLMCLGGRGQATINCEDYCIDRSHGLLIAPGEQMRASLSQDCEQLYVRISRQAIEEHSDCPKLQFRRNVDLASPLIRPWLRQIETIISDPDTSALLHSEPRVAKEYERLLISLLLAGQPHGRVQQASSVAPGSVRRAESYIEAHKFEPLTLSEIARAAGVSPRTLSNGFRSFRETSPMRYLRDMRLDHARALLSAGDVDTAARAAMDSGLMHLGRFSRDYAERFGEKPSETLRAF